MSCSSARCVFSRPSSSSSSAADTGSPQTSHSIVRISLASLDVVAQELALDSDDLRQPPLVAPLAGELSAQVGPDDVARERGTDHASAEAEDVAVVVLDALVCRVGVV